LTSKEDILRMIEDALEEGLDLEEEVLVWDWTYPEYPEIKITLLIGAQEEIDMDDIYKRELH